MSCRVVSCRVVLRCVSCLHSPSQLEENIDKWSLDLEDMEKSFLNQVPKIFTLSGFVIYWICFIYLLQATMVNSWDQLLLKNGTKIVSLNESVSAVRADQQVVIILIMIIMMIIMIITITTITTITIIMIISIITTWW